MRRENLFRKMKNKAPLHLSLVDPGALDYDQTLERALAAAQAGTDAILVGGSTNIIPEVLDNLVLDIKRETGLPVILFPGNINGLSRNADAVLFLSLLNSLDPYYISGVQVQAAPIVLRMGIEVIPTAYIIIGYGGAVGHVGRAHIIPWEKPSLVASYALAGIMMGMKAVYLEAGSGSPRPISSEAVKMTRLLLESYTDDFLLIVGGGIRDAETARSIIEAGADAIVTGTILEENVDRAVEIVNAVKSR
ncbi:MAG: geranylgeranylglyceryl/heptaprenylglyceryl phosphate synthase [Desulfurococcales archaeon]|nr:geranylgeranylglyceryl/heptaprenylglyceryl phosphate synthase [Desulfurococcales archaeon]